jgi:hypothetical protein
MRTGRSKCLCTGMLFDPAWEKEKNVNDKKIKKRSLLDIINKLKPVKNGSKNTPILLMIFSKLAHKSNRKGN